ncbi:MAG: energy transducer TonB, partial [Gemmatimonadaceae bacterium]
RKKEASAGGTVLSIVFHVVVGLVLVWVTASAGNEAMKARRQEDVKFVQVKKPPPPEPEKPPPPQVVVTPPPPKGFQVPVPPVNIPDKIPDVDLSKSVTNEADFSGKGQEGGVARGVVGGTGHVNNDQPYFEFQVEKPVLAREGNPTPAYPSMLESARVAGEVMAQFVVDTTGRVDMSTFKVLKTTNDLFTSSVKNALSRSRFYPAETGGRKVKQVVQQPFIFKAPS